MNNTQSEEKRQKVQNQYDHTLNQKLTGRDKGTIILIDHYLETFLFLNQSL